MSFPFNYSAIPSYMRDGLILYIERGIQPGSFMQAVLENDLKEACGRADDKNIHVIPVYVAWLYNNAPIGCFGSRNNFSNWIDRGGLSRASGLEDSFTDH